MISREFQEQTEHVRNYQLLYICMYNNALYRVCTLIYNWQPHKVYLMLFTL